jgi:hypothetical protein
MTTHEFSRCRVMIFLTALLCGVAAAQTQEAPATAPAPQGPALSSTEQGQTTLDESFNWAKRAERIRKQRWAALTNTQFNAEFRTMYLDRNKYDSSESEAWAIGGSAGFKTGFFRERLALGLTGYTSQKLLGDEDKDGTLLLKPGQKGYTVLGELYGDAMIVENVHLYAGRKAYDTPYINRNDVRMTPNTFEAVTLQGKTGGGDAQSSFSYGGGYFSRIKERNSDEFVPMSEDAGSTVDRGVYTAGANYKAGGLSLGAIDYYSDDIINIAYTEAKYAIPLPADLKLKVAAQYSDQESTGDNLLNGENFSANQVGVKVELPVGGATFTAAYTDTGDASNMQNPWSGYPGYTSVQVEDFNRAGEKALLLRAAYEFSSVKGLSAYVLWVSGTDPVDPAQYERDEYDLNLQWKAADGLLKGLTLRARYAVVTQDEGDVEDLDDLRLLCYYDLSSWM